MEAAETEISLPGMDKLFFSIITPAHNEERYIEKTLEHLKALDYPQEKFEVIVVENGSSDRTFMLAKKFEGGNFRIFQSAKGTSKAKNFGIDRISTNSDWVIFLDADTLLGSIFLVELNGFLQKKGRSYSVGAFSVHPMPETHYARFWFFLFNVSRVVSATSQSIKAVRRSLFPPIRFDEALVTGEDIDVIRQAQRFGKFFFFWTPNVRTSTRRFAKLGWWYIMFYWSFVALLPVTWQRQFRYDEVR